MPINNFFTVNFLNFYYLKKALKSLNQTLIVVLLIFPAKNINLSMMFNKRNTNKCLKCFESFRKISLILEFLNYLSPEKP